ncbi:hypothetical protein M0804_009376 [Polistes exclamans]|nr:hypothetical protein M0804_009376 [Polistes exclamans]
MPPSSMSKCSSFVPFRMMNRAEFQSEIEIQRENPFYGLMKHWVSDVSKLSCFHGESFATAIDYDILPQPTTTTTTYSSIII